MQPSLIADLIVLGVLALFVILGIRRGLILSLCGLAALVVALVGADYLSDTFTPTLAQTIRPAIESKVQTALDEVLEGSSFNQTQPEDTHQLEGIWGVLQRTELYQNNLDLLTETVGEQVNNTIQELAQSISEALAQTAARIALFYGGFFLILLLWRIFSRGLDLFFKLPVLAQLNAVGGCVFGFVEGLLILCVAVWLLCGVFRVVPEEVLQSSRLLPMLLNANPFV